ncbi:NAD(P)/FAD-dependent oxidoreductase [Streptomyces fragilis]|uniref:FAD-dependent monooxygenase n=1 Tax=Streptomyces fragilis TaxID=67301 RepID=A0ABV2YJX5_9ACTN|nr:FAD-dependent monooxygenase [Streptomyces fragilis]
MSGRASSTRQAVVIGGGLAGFLAARALAGDAAVTIVERDTLPTVPEPRKNLPQARHLHNLWSGGAGAVEQLLPGTLAELQAHGARRIPLTSGMVAYSPAGWYRRWDDSHYSISCSRDLLDWVIRGQVLAGNAAAITVLQRTQVLGLVGDAAAVTGVRIRNAAGEEETLNADLVVDAGGRASRTPHWLLDLGLDGPTAREVDSGLVYASRTYQAPPKTPAVWPIINIQADPRSGGPARSGAIQPIEDDRWLVTLSGTRGAEPPRDPKGFEEFAQQLRHPLIAEALVHAQPLTDVTLSRTTVNQRRYYEKTRMPRGLLVLGDAVAATNPTYGHGMSVAAQSALTLRDTLRRRGWAAPDLARHVQKGITRHLETAWTFATGSDVFFPGASENGPTVVERLAARYIDRLIHTATGSGRVARAVTDVMTLEAGPARLLSPDTLIAAARGPLKPSLQHPPLTAEEWQAIRN